MKELKERIVKIIDQFAQEEMGNRLSQFAMLSLKSLILNEFMKVEQEMVKEDADRKVS